MPSTIVDSAHLRRHLQHRRDARRLFRRGRTAALPRHRGGAGRVQGRLGIIPQEAADEIVSNCTPRPDRHGELRRQTERIGYPVLGVVQQIVGLAATPRRMVPLGRDDAGHHRHGDGAADPRGARAGRRRADRDLGGAGRLAPRAPRHADGRPQQPAAGGADHVRLQDGGAARGHRAPSRAAGGAAPARARRRVRRRRRHAGVARERRDGDPGRPDAPSSASASPTSPGTRCATASPRPAASSDWSPARSASSRST